MYFVIDPLWLDDAYWQQAEVGDRREVELSAPPLGK